jgi:anti-anti-sigma factor
MTEIAGPYHLDFKVEVVPEGQVTRVVLSGEIDMATAPLLQDRLLAALADGARAISIDLALVTFIDSSGLDTFLRAARSAEENGKGLSLANCPDRLRKVFEVTRTDGLFAGTRFSELAQPAHHPGGLPTFP